MKLQDFLKGDYINYNLILTTSNSKLQQLSKEDLIILLNKGIREADFWKRQYGQMKNSLYELLQTLSVIDNDIKQTYSNGTIIKLEEKA